MRQYKCHKEVHATPMTRLAYNILRGWAMPDNENGADEGYVVIYGYGTDDHYVSWSPKKQFEEGYSPRVEQQPLPAGACVLVPREGRPPVAMYGNHPYEPSESPSAMDCRLQLQADMG